MNVKEFVEKNKIKENEYLKAKEIVQEYEKQMNISKKKPKIIVRYSTEFGSSSTTLELHELKSFIKRFNVISLEYK